MKTKSIERIEERMGGVEQDSVRHRALQSAKNFKTSWIELGQALYSVWKDKSYKEWGYITFDAYTQKEIGVKKSTAMKLLKSYYFLEKEEPVYLQKDVTESTSPAAVPSYESVNLLRLAKNRNALDGGDYQRFRKDVLDRGKEPGEFKKDLTALMREREELTPDEARKRRRLAAVKRLISALKALKTEIETQKLLPIGFVKDITALVKRLEAEII